MQKSSSGMFLNRTKAILRQVEMFTCWIKSFQDIFEATFARGLLISHSENFQVSMKLVKRLAKFAEKKYCTPAHLPLL